jgi:ribonucleoside-diphosphate reductase alpha chain
MLANVILLNGQEEMHQTKISSLRKREVGLGVFGLAHALAISHIAIDTDKANEWMDEVFEEIAYNVVKASMEKAKETGDIAPAFATSKWADGSFITNKFMAHSQDKERWAALNEDVMKYGMFSTVLMATAPTETISYAANTTAGTDPIYGKEYTLEKSGLKTNMVAPDIDDTNFFFYKDAFIINKAKYLEGVGIRQRWIDQSISTNLYYIKDNLKALDMVQDYITAWKNGVKTIYYHRSQTATAYQIACESCSG